MKPFFLIVSSLFALASVSCSKPEVSLPSPRFGASKLGISFTIPKGFEIQERKQQPWEKNRPEVYMIQSTAHPDTEYPLDLSICSYNEKYTAMLMSVPWQKKGNFEKTIGSHTVFDFPGFPGPYGENAFFYLVPRGDGTSIGILAPRFLSKRGVSLTERPPSGMDSIIKVLIATITFENNARSK